MNRARKNIYTSEYVQCATLKSNKENPRRIDDVKFGKLVASIRNFSRGAIYILSMKISRIGHDEVYGRLSGLLRKERVAIKKIDIKTKYLGLMDGVKLAGVVGWQQLREGHLRFKTDYIKREYRGGGWYSVLWAGRWRSVCGEDGDKWPSTISTWTFHGSVSTVCGSS